MSTTVFKYETYEGGEKYDFVSTWDEDDAEYLAQDAAEDYHSNHDGWESHWPIDFTLFREDGTKIGEYTVDRDVEPVFFARIKK